MNYGKHQGFRGVCMAMAGALTLAIAPWVVAQQAAPAAAPAAAPPAATAAAGQPAAPAEGIDEVVVLGGRLYDRIVSAEDRFFKLYNELNKEDDFDTNCAFVPIDPGSRTEQRFCMPSFFADAEAEMVRLDQYCKSLISKDEDGNVTSEGVCYRPPTAEQIFFSRRDAYVDNVIKVINSDPRLKNMAQELDAMHRERDALAHKYDDIKKKNMATNGEKRDYRPTIR